MPVPDFSPDEFEGSAERLTPTFTVLAGKFQLSRASVPYFQTNVTMDDLRRHLKLVEDLPVDEREKWTLEELFQRDIDWERVEEEIVKGYLQARTKRTFFNALTVALLPLGADGRLDSHYGVSVSAPATDGPFGSADFKTIRVGGIDIARRSMRETSVGYLRWNEGRTFAATIDGQHRLAALRTFLERSRLTAHQLETRVPVIFLVMDERLGFHLDDADKRGARNPLLSVVREIFIDLNKHAKPVSIARQVLLDDQEIEARCTRTLLEDAIAQDTQNRDDATSLPLGLVDWQSAQVKFDQGPYLSTVTALYLVTREILSLRSPADPLDEGEVKKFAQSVQQSLRVNEQVESADGLRADEYRGRPKLMEYIQKHFLDDDAPLTAIPRPYASAAVDYFEKCYKPLIIGVFRGFQPYREFWDLSASQGGTSGTLAHFLSLNDRTRKQRKEELLKDQEYQVKIADPLALLLEKKKGEWGFMVVWQKALLKATVDAYINSQAVLALDRIPTPEVFLEQWVSFLNKGHAMGHFKLDALIRPSDQSRGELWEGIGKNPVSRTVKYSNAASMRIRDLLMLFWFIESHDLKSGGELVEQLGLSDSNSRFPGGARSAQQLESSLKTVIKQRFSDEDEEQIAAGAKARLIEVLDRWRI